MNYKVGDLLRLNTPKDKESVCIIVDSYHDNVFDVFWIQTAENASVKNSSSWKSWSTEALRFNFTRLSP